MATCVRHLCSRHLRYLHKAHRVSSLPSLRAFSTSINKHEKEQPEIYRRVLDSFPTGIQTAFAYGSGVFQQTGQEMNKNMLDFIFVVDDSVQWHTDNLAKHKHHYSFLSMFGPKYIATFQDGDGAGVYFNTLVNFEDRLIKYGVVNTKTVISDLTDWDTLYISGRLHKPVYFLKQPSSLELSTAIVTNLNSAVHASLLLLPEKFTEEYLYITITGLSYTGDFRMKFGEDKGKVRKIVTPNMQYFRNLYQPILEQEEHVHWNQSSGSLEQSLASDARFHHLKLLPENVLNEIYKFLRFLNVSEDVGDETGSHVILEMISNLDTCPNILADSLTKIVGQSSWRQSIKGIATAGIGKSVRYSSKKVTKMFKGLKSTGS